MHMHYGVSQTLKARREAKRIDRENQKLKADGWEYVGESGGMLWELYRGGRTNHEIVAVCIAPSKKALFVKTRARTAGTEVIEPREEG